MRTREEIEKHRSAWATEEKIPEGHIYTAVLARLSLEVLLDIRDLLNENPQEKE